MLAMLWRGERRAWLTRALSAVLSVGIGVSVAQAELTVQDFRGSTLSVTNAVSYGTINKSLDLTYNPFFSTTTTIAPRYWIGKNFVAGRISIDREWTERDDGTFRDETRLSDLTLRVGSLIHRWDFGLLNFVGAGVRLPTSLASQTRTMNASYNAVIALIQSLSSWGSLSYSFNVAYNHFRYTTGEIETPRIPGTCTSDPGACSFLNTGVRNAPWTTTHSLGLNYFPKSWLFVSVGASLIESYLFNRNVDDSMVSYVAQEPTNKRYLVSYNTEVDIQPTPWLVVALMASTFNPQLAPNSTYYAPFFNRNTSFMLDLRFTLGVFRVAQSDDDSKSKVKRKRKNKQKQKQKSDK